MRWFLPLMILSCSVVPVASAKAPDETDEHFRQRMQWWKDARLGLFLHWGVYSTFGGEYGGRDHGKEMGHASAEWIYLKADIPEEEYRRAARRFSADDFDPRDWVRQAKAAGMKYIVLTSKHHDGFALFDTAASSWNAVQASGAHRDLIREYVDACHELGMKVGFYYSHEKDWFHHQRRTKSFDPVPASYVELVRTQLHELFTHYGTIDVIWFDTPIAEHEELNRMCASIVRELQPNCIISGRIGNNLGDYRNIGDRAIVDPGLGGYYESIMTMRLNWGYDRNDDYWKSSNDLIRMVSQSACRGSNFLLNIGPTPEGTFPPEDQVRLRDLGIWIQQNGEAIYATDGNPFAHEHPWGSFTVSADRRTVFLHLWNWAGGPVELHGLKTPATSASFLADGAPLEFTQTLADATTRILLPDANRFTSLPVVRLDLANEAKFSKEHAPRFSPDPVHHVTAQMITGKITRLDGTRFSVIGHRLVSDDAGAEVFADKEETLSLSLNDHTRYRINTAGDIRSVQGFALREGGRYEIVFSPLPAGPVLEIVTELR